MAIVEPNGNNSSNGGSQTYVAISGNDDAAAIAAAGQDIGLKVGTYKSNAGATFTQQTRLEGRGMANGEWTTWLTKITCNTDGIDAIYFNALGCVFRDFAVEYTGAGTATSGTGIRAPLSSGMRAQDVAVKGFWNNFVLGGFYWTARGLLSVDPVNIGIYVTNSVPDHGDAVLSDFFILAGSHSAAATALKWDSGGGLKIMGGKISSPANAFLTGIDIHAPLTTNTSEITVADTVVDTVTGVCVNVAVDGGGGGLSGVSFDNVFLRGSSNPTNGYKIRGATDVKIVGGGVELASNALSCIDIDTTGRVTIEGVELGGLPVGNPMILLGASCISAKVKPGNLKSPAAAGGSAWTTGTRQFILRNLNTGGTPLGGGGNVYEFSFRHPTITSTVTYSALWTLAIPTGGSVLVDVMIVCQNPAGGTVSGVGVYQRRLIVNQAGTLAATVVGTDTATSANDVDVQWLVSTSFMDIKAKINGASALTSLGNQLYSTVRIVGSLQDVYAYP